MQRVLERLVGYCGVLRGTAGYSPRAACPRATSGVLRGTAGYCGVLTSCSLSSSIASLRVALFSKTTQRLPSRGCNATARGRRWRRRLNAHHIPLRGARASYEYSAVAGMPTNSRTHRYLSSAFWIAPISMRSRSSYMQGSSRYRPHSLSVGTVRLAAVSQRVRTCEYPAGLLVRHNMPRRAPPQHAAPWSATTCRAMVRKNGIQHSRVWPVRRCSQRSTA